MCGVVDLVFTARLGDMLLRPLLESDAELVVDATAREVEPSFWAPRPAGAYSLADARSALREWDPAGGVRASYGFVQGDRLLAVAGLQVDGPGSAEVAYWVPSEQRRRGYGRGALIALTGAAHDTVGLGRLWLEIEPDNEASLRMARRAGYVFERRAALHCRSWVDEDPARDTWHDCLIWGHTGSRGS
jgi:RimJ/RimL family protein N-acetyltransferase